jgi:ATPase family associated with various cellular activities (AAA)
MVKRTPGSSLSADQLLTAAAAIVARDAGIPTPPDWDRMEVGIRHDGRHITLPAEPGKMPEEKAIEALQRKIDDENQMFSVVEIIDAYPHDGAIAFYKAMCELYGWASPQAIRSFFGDRLPEMMSIKVGPRPDQVVQVPVGMFMLPGVEEEIYTDFTTTGKDDKPVFRIHGQVKKKDKHLLVELAQKTREIIARESIYRGQPIAMKVDDDGDLDFGTPPEFIDVSEVRPDSDLLFDADIKAQIETNLFVPIRQTATCRKHNIPLRRGILLSGAYGTGKSLTARSAAKVAQENGWTFILLDKIKGLKVALEFANRYAPAVVFAEDVDRVAAVRTDTINDLINTIDGVVSKRAEIMTVLTTNFIERLDPVILRPGRLDAVITLRPPGPDTVQKLIRHYAGMLVAVNEDLSAAGEELAGQIPATIREAVERAKLGMIGRRGDNLTCEDLVIAAQTMKNHLVLLAKQPNEQSEADKLASALRNVLGGSDGKPPASISVTLSRLNKEIEVMHEHIHEIQAAVAAGKSGGNGHDLGKLEKKMVSKLDTVIDILENN